MTPHDWQLHTGRNDCKSEVNEVRWGSPLVFWYEYSCVIPPPSLHLFDDKHGRGEGSTLHPPPHVRHRHRKGVGGFRPLAKRYHNPNRYSAYIKEPRMSKQLCPRQYPTRLEAVHSKDGPELSMSPRSIYQRKSMRDPNNAILLVWLTLCSRHLRYS